MARYVTGFFGQDVDEVYAALLRFNQIALRLRRTNPILGTAIAREALDIARSYRAELQKIERQTAARVTKGMKSRLKDTAVRGPTSGQLSDALIARPLQYRLPTGSVGIADIDQLDAVINPYARTPKGRKPYWRAQEEGSTAQVGREVRGGFFGLGGTPGPFKPRQSSFRQSPLFIAQGKGAAGRMRIERPIHARHFIGKTIAVERPVWLARMEAADLKVQARMTRLASSGVRARGAGRLPRRR